MSATRTQIYLTEDQRRRIDQVTAREGIPMAAVIRNALDAYLDEDADADEALQATFGIVPDASAPSRDDWQRG